MSLGKTLFSGGLWLLSQRLITTIASFLGGVILARLLMPEDFGAVAMATAFTAIIGRFSSMGISQEIMRLDESKKDYHQYLSSFFWINLLILSAAFIIAFGAIQIFGFSSPETLSILPFVMLGVFISNIFSPARIILQKQLRFKTASLIELYPNLLGLVGSIYMALNGYGIWALVIPPMLVAILNSLIAFYCSGLNLSLSLKKGAIQRIRLNYFWYLFQSLTTETYHKADDLIIGSFFGNAILGFYKRAYSLAEHAHKIIGSIIQSLGYPIYANKSYSNEDKYNVFYVSNKIILYALGGFIILLAAHIEQIIGFIYGEKWLSAAQFFIYLVPFAILLPLYQSYKKLLIGFDEIRFVTKIDVLKLFIMMAGSFSLMGNFGTQGILFAVNISMMTSILITSLKLYKYELLRINDLIKPYSFVILQGSMSYYVSEYYLCIFCVITLVYLWIERHDIQKIYNTIMIKKLRS